MCFEKSNAVHSSARFLCEIYEAFNGISEQHTAFFIVLATQSEPHSSVCKIVVTDDKDHRVLLRDRLTDLLTDGLISGIDLDAQSRRLQMLFD
jgi:hypothetical protein